MKNIEEKIRMLIVQKDISFEQFVDKLDVTKQTVYNIFKRNEINSGLLEKIAGIFNVPVSYFFDDDFGLPDIMKKADKNKEMKKQSEGDDYVLLLKDRLKDKDEMIGVMRKQLSFMRRRILRRLPDRAKTPKESSIVVENK